MKLHQCLCKQYFWLVNHTTLHILAYQRRMNILSTVIENNTKVKEMLRKQTENLDATGNIQLNFEFYLVSILKASLQKLLQQNRNQIHFLLGYKNDPEAIIIQHQQIIISPSERVLWLRISKAEAEGEDFPSVG